MSPQLSPQSSQTLATYQWQEEDGRFAPLPGENRKNHAMVEVIVCKHGDQMEFIVHQEMLTRYKPNLFASILGEVGNTTLFRLEEDPQVFFGLLQYAYRGRFWRPETVKSIEVLWNIYIFVEKKGISHLQDVMMNRITAFYLKSNAFPCLNTIWYVYSNTSKETVNQKPSMARRFLSRCYLSIQFGCLFGAKVENRVSRFHEVVQSDDDLLMDSMNATRGRGPPYGHQWKVDLDPRTVNPCQYHQHGADERCVRYLETFPDKSIDT
ncbi:hypothetical protein NHQ30_009252 [Ciborinia camelliae]|nr:hypothetical protein NHQ30_009252 [Ciborinia camelliae]